MTQLGISIRWRKNRNQYIYIYIPERLRVKAGFHHDLKANAKEELRGPVFPCKTMYTLKVHN